MANIEDMKKLLSQLGFEHKGAGKFHHAILNREFDFSGSSLEGIPHWIFHDGKEVGIKIAQRKIRNAIGVGGEE